VVWVKALEGTITGFFVAETGVIAKNAHVTRGDSTRLALLSMRCNYRPKLCTSIRSWTSRW
jgi:hypothetical protein